MDATEGPFLFEYNDGDVGGVGSDDVDAGVDDVGGIGGGAIGESLRWRGISRKGLPNRYWRRLVHAVPSQKVSWSDPSLTGYQPLVVGVAGKLSSLLDIERHLPTALNVPSQLD
jgi:hypothetical protein